MLTSAQIRQQFLDFFREKQHTIVPSSSLMPDSPNLLFTNAGMNQFVPIFLGERSPDVSKWAGAIPGLDTRAADTQKCIRAGGKHNDLDDVGLDTYHHTFFEMLGNWSFGDYFKKEAIEWAWELVVERWKFPTQRVYATIYCPHMQQHIWAAELDWLLNDERLDSDLDVEDYRWAFVHEILPGCRPFGIEVPLPSDVEAAQHWARLFKKVGLDPRQHIVPGNKKDNFWMMGETGPCGPCSELHVDLTPDGDTRGSLVNAGDARCIEIWNLVFIQFNACPDGTLAPLPAKHVDTGMGFERVTSIIQGTKGFTDFANAKISNYETDIFRPIFDELEKMSGTTYGGTLPPGSTLVPSVGEGVPPSRTSSDAPDISNAPSASDVSGSSSPRDAATNTRDACAPRNSDPAQIQIDVAFRVIADHIRTLSFAIADGIQPGNTDRNYVLRRILRRAVRYGRTLGFHEPFFYKLVAVLARTMGDVFPEIRAKQKHVEEVLKREEEAFNKTLDRGIELFKEKIVEVAAMDSTKELAAIASKHAKLAQAGGVIVGKGGDGQPVVRVAGNFAFQLYDTYGFPLDLTELMARERGMTVDTVGFGMEMEKQRARARAAQKRQIIELSEIETKEPTCFVGYDRPAIDAVVLEVVEIAGKTAVITEITPFYAEMGGQVGDTGEITQVNPRKVLPVVKTQKIGNAVLHFLGGAEAPDVGAKVIVCYDQPRRRAIERHHTVTHLLHWALHEVVSHEATQKGSFVGPDKLTFDFNSAALTPAQVRDIERLVNEKIVENAGVAWTEVPYAEVRGRADIMQFFGDKYGETVRVVDIGGYSRELCAGTHTRATGEIGLFRINAEAAIAAGVRRIEAVAGLNAYDFATTDTQRLHALATKIGTPLPELEKRIEGMLAQQKELEKALKAAQQREAAGRAKDLLASAQTINGVPAIIANLGAADGDTLQTVADALKSHGFKGVTVLGGSANGAVALVAAVSAEFTAKAQAGKIIQTIAPLVGGKGGGKPDNARGGGKDPSQLDAALAKAKELLG
jgi:alanyl-tRNA synthetase